MSQSEFGKIIELAKLLIEEEAISGREIILEKNNIRKNNVSAYKTQINEGSGGELESYRKEIAQCMKCPLGKTRIKFVFGEGNPHSKLLFVGEGPGYDEDRQGKPFVGRAGQLLTKIIEAIGLKREDVFIANIVKCHPLKDPLDREKRGNDRPPSPEEISKCFPYLKRQIELIKPQIICTLGSFASKTLLETEETITNLRGKFRLFNNILLMPTYHPAALLRNPALKKDVWEDMKKIRAELNNFGKNT